MPRPGTVLVFGRTVFEVWPDSVRTILPDGATLPAAAQDTPEYRAMAQRLGYGADTALMCLEHEAAHSWICALLGMPESPTLGRVARSQGNTDLTRAEEALVLALQEFCRRAGVDLLARMTKT